MALPRIGQHPASLAILEKAVSLGPSQPAAHCNLGVAFFNCNEFENSLASYERAITLNPAYAEAHNNRGNALMEIGRPKEAIESYDRAITFKPNNVEATWNKALALLTIGDYSQGWRLHECRWDRSAFAPIKRQFDQPLWLGRENLRGKTILLYCEQGMGDTIQFCRYVPMVKALGAKVIFEIDPDLMLLMNSLAGVDNLILRGDMLPQFDFQCPLMSLPLAFRTALDSVPAHGSYLNADTARLKRWRQILGPPPVHGGRIGLVWRGNPSHRNDHNRSIPLEQVLAPLPTNIQYVSLQRDLRFGERAVMQLHPNIVSFEDRIVDFADTAAICYLLDEVITVDTSVAHLSAALGKKTRIMVPTTADWRWLRGRHDSPWYPTVRLYRQERPGDWSSVFDALNEDILK